MEHVLPSKNLEKNALLKIPNFTLQDVEFLEELGEGAFGKMMISIIIIHEFSRSTNVIYNIFTPIHKRQNSTCFWGSVIELFIPLLKIKELKYILNGKYFNMLIFIL